jgi:hypothetical protein
MKTRTIVWIGVTVVLCLTSFWLGGRKQSRELGATNFLSLIDDKVLLDHLRTNDTTNAIAKLEFLEDEDILRIMNYEPSLRGKERYALDKVLVSIAHDRARYREATVMSTNEPAELQQIDRDWANREAQIDAFLSGITKQPRE